MSQILDILKGIRATNDVLALEIAGPSAIFKSAGEVPIYSEIDQLDDFSFPRPVDWGGRDLTSSVARTARIRNQYVGDAVDMSIILDETYDIVLASHVLEHIANPFRALFEWKRILKRDGFLLNIVPHRDETFDRRRPITSFQHLLYDYVSGTAENDMTHHSEVRKLSDEKFEERWFSEASEHRGLHHHVFDTYAMLDIYSYVGLRVVQISTILPFHIVVLCAKNVVGADLAKNPKAIKEILKSSPFQTDRNKLFP